MAKTSDWGEPKENQTIRITATSKHGLQQLGKSLGLSMNELIERFGRAYQDPAMGGTLYNTLTKTIATMQNMRKANKSHIGNGKS